MKVFNYVLQRFVDDGEATTGIVYSFPPVNELPPRENGLASLAKVKPLFTGFSLEDQYREKKVKGDTRIWADLYEIRIRTEETALTTKYRRDPRFRDFFKFHLEICGVRDFIGTYLHVGNTEKDTEGCVLLGDQAAPDPVGPDRILKSTDCYVRFYKYLYPELEKGHKAFIRILDEIDLPR